VELLWIVRLEDRILGMRHAITTVSWSKHRIFGIHNSQLVYFVDDMYIFRFENGEITGRDYRHKGGLERS
jgi:hypothetical protein